MPHRFSLLTLSALLALGITSPHQAHAGLLRKALGVGAVTEGVLYVESYNAIGAAVTGVGMAACATNPNCAELAVKKLIYIMQTHPLIGQKVVEKSLVNYTEKHPDKAESIEQVKRRRCKWYGHRLSSDCLKHWTSVSELGIAP